MVSNALMFMKLVAYLWQRTYKNLQKMTQEEKKAHRRQQNKVRAQKKRLLDKQNQNKKSNGE